MKRRPREEPQDEERKSRPEREGERSGWRRGLLRRSGGTRMDVGSATGMDGGGSSAWDRVTEWARRHGSSLLFVDDNSFLLETTARVFQRVGASCRTASTHDDAVRALAEDEGLRLVILDFEMPDGDVAELVRRLRALRPGVVLVGTSGGDRRREFAERGIEHFVPKPWRLGDLLELTGP